MITHVIFDLIGNNLQSQVVTYLWFGIRMKHLPVRDWYTLSDFLLFFVRKAYVDLISWKFYLFTKARSHFSEENIETISSLTSYPELRRSEFLIWGYVGAKASLLSTTPLFVTMTQKLVARGDTLRLSAPRHSVTPSVIDEQRPMWSSAPFPEMSSSSGGDFLKSHKLSRTM